ncbi:MAG: efflux RND transporter periplasmic adaptor subunit [Nitrospinae bacterium]|nr:efflux RND transporter periplasmic adaptor subunit [Nitrospinota bacterium]
MMKELFIREDSLENKNALSKVSIENPLSKRFLLSLSYLLLTACCLLLFSGCEKKKETKQVKEKFINVQAQPVEKRSLRPFISAIGTLNPYEEVAVSTEIDGILKDVNADDGTKVSKGMLLSAVDDTDYSLEVERSYAALKEADANLSNTKLEYQRKEELYKKGLITRQQFDDVTTKLSLSDAELEKAKSSLAIAKQRLSKVKIYSPISGVVKKKVAAAGSYVRNGNPLFTIIQTNPLKLNFTITETDVGKLKMGQDVLFTVYAFPDREFKGELSVIYPYLDEKTRTLQVEAKVSNSDELLKPGFFVRVMLYTGQSKDKILVPVTSLIYEEDRIKVFVVEGNLAKERPVNAGQKYRLQLGVGSRESGVKEYTEIIEGVKEGELIVTVGQQNLFENAKVKIVGGKD